ncbi:MAG TPA: VWA domain-containing protein, partial [Gemmatimonadales bacterium]|nr:VWA domain-containing protein [Gemmatimonadales bacterium]
NVTARLGSAYVKRYLEERELSVLFVLDVSASGRFGTRLRTKQSLAVEVCAVLALAAARNSDRVGAVWVTDRVEHFVPPRRGRRHALRVINDLLAFEPAGSSTDLGAALRFVDSILRRRAVVFLVSDFLTSGYQSEVERLARRHDLIALQLYDPRERELPDIGLVTLREPESGRWRRVDTGRVETRERFRSRAAEFDRALQRELRQSGADLVQLETGQSYAERLLAFFRRRERAGRR